MSPKELTPDNPEALLYDEILKEYLKQLNDPFLME